MQKNIKISTNVKAGSAASLPQKGTPPSDAQIAAMMGKTSTTPINE